MKNLLASLAAKITAVFLFMLFFAACLSALVGIAYLADQDGYEQNGYSYYDSYACNNVSYNYADDVYYNYLPLALEKEPSAADAYQLEQEEAAYSAENTNFFFTVADEDGNVVLSNYKDEKYGSKEVYSFDDDTYDENGNLIETAENYSITAYVADPITVKDDYYSSYQLLTTLYNLRYWMIVAAALSFVLSILLFIFLMAAAGHRKHQEGISLNAFEKVPLDVYALGILLLGMFMMNFLWNGPSGFWEAVFICAVLVGLALFAILFSMIFAAQVKAGKWWRNTLIYKILHFVVHTFHGVYTNLPLLWKVVVGFAAYLFINIFTLIAAFSGGSGFAALLNFFFNLAVFVGLCHLVLQLNKLKKGGERIATGDYETKIDTQNMYWDLKTYAETLNDISHGMSHAVDERIKSERLKAELITNVSHDLKTPLTSIINYVDLLKKEEIENKTAQQYIEVLDRQSTKLKKLTEDLVEASKASTGNITFNPERVNVAEFLNQLLGEYAERFAANQLESVVRTPDQETAIWADGRLMWRVFDNLLNNICKYSLANTRVYFDVDQWENQVKITLKNISGVPLNITADELMERFVRGDSARTTEGSGLGLSIAKSLIELQHGGFELSVDGDLFKVVISFDHIH